MIAEELTMEWTPETDDQANLLSRAHDIQVERAKHMTSVNKAILKAFDGMIELPEPMNIYAVTLCNLNVMDAPEYGATFLGVIPEGTKVPVVRFVYSPDANKIYMSIGGHPEQFITAYHNHKANVSY